MTPAVHHLLRRPGAAPGAGLHPDLETTPGEPGGAILACIRCRHAVTSAAARIDMAGGHQHTFSNPHGIVYRIGCFADAPGCAAIGYPSTYFTWFAGYAWQVACCAACREHVGWLFRSADSLFYGLILDRLVEIEERGR
jgi:hypothetical protein